MLTSTRATGIDFEGGGGVHLGIPQSKTSLVYTLLHYLWYSLRHNVLFILTVATTPQPAVNWQHLTMSKNSTGIIRALATNKLSEALADELEAQGMIGDTVYAHATNRGPDVTEYTRMKHLIAAILTSTKSNPQRYHDFIADWMAFVKTLKQLLCFFQQVLELIVVCYCFLANYVHFSERVLSITLENQQ